MTEPAPRIVFVGNAIVDVLGAGDDGFLAAQGLGKGLMHPVDEAGADRLHGLLGTVAIVAGGSAANSAAVAAALGTGCAFLGKVRDDTAGRTFVAAMTAAGVDFPVPPAAAGPATSRSVVVERTMATHLGACQTLAADDVDEALVAGAGRLFLEGYAWTSPSLAPACRKALAAARGAGRPAALTLSDAGLAAAHRDAFLGLVREGHVDLVFANRREALALAGTDDEGEALARLRRERGTWVVTRSGEGCLVVSGDFVEAVPAVPVARVVDTTGAGDAFAGGFLSGLAAGLPPVRAARLAGLAAGHVIGRVGARPGSELPDLAAAAGLSGPTAA